jgi:hypothetical protein
MIVYFIRLPAPVMGSLVTQRGTVRLGKNRSANARLRSANEPLMMPNERRIKLSEARFC